MRKSTSLISIGLLAASLLIPSVRAHADNDRPGTAKQRHELREDLQELEQLKRQRDRELRQGDKREAREYNEKIRDQQREIRRDKKEIYQHDNNNGRRRGDRDRDWWWQRDARERWQDVDR